MGNIIQRGFLIFHAHKIIKLHTKYFLQTKLRQHSPLFQRTMLSFTFTNILSQNP